MDDILGKACSYSKNDVDHPVPNSHRKMSISEMTTQSIGFLIPLSPSPNPFGLKPSFHISPSILSSLTTHKHKKWTEAFNTYNTYTVEIEFCIKIRVLKLDR